MNDDIYDIIFGHLDVLTQCMFKLIGRRFFARYVVPLRSLSGRFSMAQWMCISNTFETRKEQELAAFWYMMRYRDIFPEMAEEILYCLPKYPFMDIHRGLTYQLCDIKDYCDLFNVEARNGIREGEMERIVFDGIILALICGATHNWTHTRIGILDYLLELAKSRNISV